MPALRGEIRDRNNVVLATSIARWSAAVNPDLLQKAGATEEAVTLLAGKLGVPDQKVREIVERPGTFGWVSRKVKDDVAQAVRESGLKGIFLVKEPTPGKRYYPIGRLASHLLGTTGVDDQGLDGLEGS